MIGKKKGRFRIAALIWTNRGANSAAPKADGRKGKETAEGGDRARDCAGNESAARCFPFVERVQQDEKERKGKKREVRERERDRSFPRILR